MNDVTWWKRTADSDSRHQNHPDTGKEMPGDTNASDIVGRTGEEMPEVAHDQGRLISPIEPETMPRADDHPEGVEDSPEFHDRPGQGQPPLGPRHGADDERTK